MDADDVERGHEPPDGERTELQEVTNRRYDRTSRMYDLYDRPMDLLGGVGRRRRRLLSRARGRVLEVGVGTGRNLDTYPDGIQLTGIDASKGMLGRARQRAADLDMTDDVSLDLADVQDLPYDDDTFDTATATCVFCSVADPVRGLEEVSRVVRPDGQVLLLEHVRPRNAFLGWLFDLVTPLVRRFVGPSINRRTEANVEAAGLEIVELRRSGIWREMVARPSASTRSLLHGDGSVARTSRWCSTYCKDEGVTDAQSDRTATAHNRAVRGGMLVRPGSG